MNEELEERTRELNELTTRYAETLRGMPWPVLLVDHEAKVQLWNTAAQNLFGMGGTSIVGVDLEHLPAQEKVLRLLARKCRTVLATNKVSVLRN